MEENKKNPVPHIVDPIPDMKAKFDEVNFNTHQQGEANIVRSNNPNATLVGKDESTRHQSKVNRRTFFRISAPIAAGLAIGGKYAYDYISSTSSATDKRPPKDTDQKERDREDEDQSCPISAEIVDEYQVRYNRRKSAHATVYPNLNRLPPNDYLTESGYVLDARNVENASTTRLGRILLDTEDDMIVRLGKHPVVVFIARPECGKVTIDVSDMSPDQPIHIGLGGDYARRAKLTVAAKLPEEKGVSGFEWGFTNNGYNRKSPINVEIVSKAGSISNPVNLYIAAQQFFKMDGGESLYDENNIEVAMAVFNTPAFRDPTTPMKKLILSAQRQIAYSERVPGKDLFIGMTEAEHPANRADHYLSEAKGKDIDLERESYLSEQASECIRKTGHAYMLGMRLQEAITNDARSADCSTDVPGF